MCDFDDENDEWMQVYNKKIFNKDLFCNSINLKDGLFYLCWGGGPTGGFIILNNLVYKVNQDYDIPLNAILLENSKLITHTNNDGILFCKIIELK